ncbi:hypothetical protein XarjCFBP7652_02100 [Xanthomonas arboricola]|nr:hypothetical protein XarjCFBP7652_02100 [Xanthomonas arboricola]
MAGDWRRAAQGCAATASQTGCLTEPRSQSADALSPSPKPVTDERVARGETVPSLQPLAPRPGPSSRRGRSKARVPMARKPCLLAPTVEGLQAHRVVQNSALRGDGVFGAPHHDTSIDPGSAGVIENRASHWKINDESAFLD